MNAQIYIKVGLGWDGWMENSQITPYFFFPALPSVWTVALVDFVLTKPSAAYSCFPAAEIQCLDLASTHRQSALLHIILALRWVAQCWTLLHSCNAHCTLCTLCCTLHILLALRWVAHCTVLLLLSGWTSLQSLAFLRVIVSGHCPGSPWPRTQMLLVFRSIYMYGWRIKTGFSEGVYLESVRLKGGGVSLSRPGWESLCLGSVKILQQKSQNFATLFHCLLVLLTSESGPFAPFVFHTTEPGFPTFKCQRAFSREMLKVSIDFSTDLFCLLIQLCQCLFMFVYVCPFHPHLCILV